MQLRLQCILHTREILTWDSYNSTHGNQLCWPPDRLCVLCHCWAQPRCVLVVIAVLYDCPERDSAIPRFIAVVPFIQFPVYTNITSIKVTCTLESESELRWDKCTSLRHGVFQLSGKNVWFLFLKWDNRWGWSICRYCVIILILFNHPLDCRLVPNTESIRTSSSQGFL